MRGGSGRLRYGHSRLERNRLAWLAPLHEDSGEDDESDYGYSKPNPDEECRAS